MKKKLDYKKPLHDAQTKLGLKPPFIVFVELFVGFIFSLSSFVVFILIADMVLKKQAIQLDTAISHSIYSFRTPFLTQIMYGISFLGNEFVQIATIGITFFFFYKKHYREAFLFPFTIGMAYCIDMAIKYILRVPRPEIDPVYIAAHYSFPSGHSMWSFVFFALCAYYFFHFTHSRWGTPLVIFLCTVVIFLVGFSRIYLGVHYPSDVLAGFIAGFWWFVTVIIVDKSLHYYQLFKKSDVDKKLHT